MDPKERDQEDPFIPVIKENAPNENLRLGNYWEGIMMCLAILNEPYN